MQDPGRPSPRSVAAPRRKHRLLIALVAVGVLVVGVVVAGSLWWNQRGPSRASVSQAVDRFRSSTGQAGSSTLQPPVGVYTYAGTGTEGLSFLSTTQSQDGSLPGTVTSGDPGCWTFSIAYNSFHSQTWDYCVIDGRLVEHGNTTDQKFDFGVLSESEHTEVVCDPPTTIYDPSAAPGDHVPVRCRGHSQTTNTTMTQRGRLTYIGPSTVIVGGRRVAALHLSQDVTISGGQTGSQHEELWIATKDGLPLRESRTISVDSPAPAPLNEVTYSEHGTWQLTSLVPQT